MAQQIIDIQVSELLARAQQMKDQGQRIVQICCTKLPDRLELQYSFDKDYEFTSFRITMPNADAPVPSISGVYLSAFLYENEIHDLFGIQIDGIAVDYKGKFYRTSTPRAFNPVESAKPEGGQA
ncbi:MAG: NADH-quinone oxidoreductase subunit C [Candidatus Omnitrophica bacterium]|nr:NADH-quinone oxidoreductase subunit C [Candidatus Omnitrophota bacterium]